MCQMSVVYERDNGQEVIMENASLLEAVDGGIRVSALFEEPRFIAGATVHSIDFLHGRVIITGNGEKN